MIYSENPAIVSLKEGSGNDDEKICKTAERTGIEPFTKVIRLCYHKFSDGYTIEVWKSENLFIYPQNAL